MATHSVLLASVLILKSTLGVLLWFFAFGLAPNHHFKSSKPCSFKRNIVCFLDKKIFYLSKARYCRFPNSNAVKMEMHDPTIDANFAIVGGSVL